MVIQFQNEERPDRLTKDHSYTISSPTCTGEKLYCMGLFSNERHGRQWSQETMSYVNRFEFYAWQTAKVILEKLSFKVSSKRLENSRIKLMIPCLQVE